VDLYDAFADELEKLGYVGKPLGRLMPKGGTGTQRQALRGETADKLNALRAAAGPAKARVAYEGMRAEANPRQHPLLTKLVNKIPFGKISPDLEAKKKEIGEGVQSLWRGLRAGWKQHTKEVVK